MPSTFAIILSVVAIPSLVLVVVVKFKKRRFALVNLLLSLTFFVARSSIIYYSSPIVNRAILENRDSLNIIRDSFVWLVAWVTISALIYLGLEILVPLIHKHFAIVHTPPGIPDKVVRIDGSNRERKRA